MNPEEGLKRLKSEFTAINRKPIINIGCTVGLFVADDFYKWRCSLLGPKDSPYRGGIFYLTLTFPKDYPKSAPEIRFFTPIYHLNICPYKNSLGLVYPNFIKNWNPSTTPAEILSKIYAIFYIHNPDSPFGIKRAEEYLINKPLYEEKAKYFTKKYGNPMSCTRSYDLNKDWNFDYEYEGFAPAQESIKKIKNVPDIYNKFDGNNEVINIIFLLNGIKKINIECKLKEKIKNVITRFLNMCLYDFNDEPLFMYNSQKLNIDMQIGYLFKNYSFLTVIDVSDVVFL